MRVSLHTRRVTMPALRRTANAPAHAFLLFPSLSYSSPFLFVAVPLAFQRANKGDYGFNVFHNSNPQHGGSYARHERRMRDDEVEDFLKSVKHWTPAYEDVAENNRLSSSKNSNSEAAAEGEGKTNDEAPPPSVLCMGEEAIMRTFTFDSFREAYLFMGRVWAFCYSSDKYPHITWEGTSITVYLYSPSFRGLSKREARVAAFLNDQYNMVRKNKQQQRRIIDSIVQNAAVEEIMGREVAQALAARQARRTAPLKEIIKGPSKWSKAIAESGSMDCDAKEDAERQKGASDLSAHHRQHPQR